MLKRKNKYFSFFDYTHDNKSSFFLICDHASNFIPRKFNNLGLSSKDTLKHIAWDIGSKKLTLSLARQLKSFCYLSNFSRLLIDPNRRTDERDLITDCSGGINIPGNSNLKKSQILERLNFYNLYHANLSKIIKSKVQKNKNLKLISIHSFNKVILQKNRPNQVGLLWNTNKNLLIPLQRFFQNQRFNVGNNFPYSGFHYNFTLDKHSFSKKLDNISIEIRNDLIDDKKGIDKWSKILKLAFKELI